jgi:hypothetical protein
MRSTDPQVVAETRERMRKCMDALQQVSRVWIVAKMVYTLFESILGNKALEDRLHKSTGPRHHHPRRPNNTNSNNNNIPTEPVKRKFDEMDLGPLPTGPVPTMSYGRSRPQTPAPTPGPPPPPPPSDIQMNTTFMSMPRTRPTTPFNPSLSVPATPPELYLVTAPDTHFSQSTWENFQPHQLFPDDSGLSYPQQQQQQQQQNNNGNNNTTAPLDPQLQQQQQQQQQQLPIGMQWNPAAEFELPDMGSSPDDTWSNSSTGGIAPTTLNVEDWYYPTPRLMEERTALMRTSCRFIFFGLNGELGA